MRALYPDVLPDTLAFALEFVELEPEQPLRSPTWSSIRCGCRIRTRTCRSRSASRAGDKRLLYSGDSPWDDRFLELARGVDLFLCECTAYEEPMGRHIQWTTLRPSLPRLECKRLVLIHLGRDMRAHCGELGVECATENMKIRC